MLCYNPLLAACEAQLRVPVNILTSVQFNPAAEGRSSTTFYSADVGAACAGAKLLRRPAAPGHHRDTELDSQQLCNLSIGHVLAMFDDIEQVKKGP